MVLPRYCPREGCGLHLIDKHDAPMDDVLLSP